MSEIVFIEYPRCTTCKKAKAWHDNPTKAELEKWIPASGLPLRLFFTTSGTLYRSLGVKKMLDEGLSEDEATTLLATDGMLVKRPLVLVDGVPLTPGFKPAEWEEKLL